ncbi:MAG: TM1266 family iron-only hydrogenase system putative regulator [Eubacteriales bacterium]
METRIALIGIIVEEKDAIHELNQLLSQNSSYILGRMGIPHTDKNVSVISIVIDAPADIISSLSGKIGMLSGISSKTVYTKSRNK